MKHHLTWVAGIARLGYAARGVVYLTVGYLILNAALEIEEAEDVKEMLYAINSQPYGNYLLLGLAAGLVAYAFWRLVQSLLDVDDHGHAPRALILRAALVISAFLYASIAYACIQISLNLGTGGGSQIRKTVAHLLGWPAGRWLVGAAAVVVCITGIVHIRKAWVGGFRKWFAASAGAMCIIDPVSRVGLIARGLLFVAISAFVLYSAITLDASDAGGLKTVLVWAQQRIYGRFLLGGMGAGLFAFGAYSLIEAFVRRVGLDDDEKPA